MGKYRDDGHNHRRKKSGERMHPNARRCRDCGRLVDRTVQVCDDCRAHAEALSDPGEPVVPDE